MQCKVQMERLDGSVLDTSTTCDDLGQKCLQLPGMLTLRHFEINSFPNGKGNVTALNNTV